MPGREDAAPQNNSLWVASLACTEQHLTLHHVFIRHCNTGHGPENRPSITAQTLNFLELIPAVLFLFFLDFLALSTFLCKADTVQLE